MEIRTFIACAIICMLLLIPALGFSQRRMSSGFENGMLDSINFYEGCCAWSAIKTAHWKNRGSYSIRLEQRRNDPQVSTSSLRVELNVNSTNTLANRYDIQFIRFTTFIPSDSNQLDPGRDYIMTQFKQPGTGGVQTGGSPPLALLVDGNSVYADIRWATAAQPNNNNNSNRRKLYVGPLGRDSAIHYVIQYKRSHLPGGVIRIWRNDELVLSDTGRNYFEGAALPSIKFGFYSFRWAITDPPYGGSAVPYRVLYLDDVGVFGPASTYDDVALYRKPAPEPEDTISVNLPDYVTNADTITMTAATHSNNPIVSYTFTRLSGPNSPTVSVPAAGSIFLSDLQEGNYIYRIEVVDSEGNAATDENILTVNSAPSGQFMRLRRRVRVKNQIP